MNWKVWLAPLMAVVMLFGAMGLRQFVRAQTVRTNNPVGYEFVRIPAGDGVAEFEIGKYDVTVAQFRKFVEATGYRTTAEKQGWSYGYDGKDWGIVKSLNWRYGASLNDQEEDNHPVVNISWEDAKAFCNWVGGRLPSCEEWEHAARGGLQGKKYVWGDAWPPPHGSGNFADVTAKRKYPTMIIIEDYDDGYADISPVGSFEPNGYGLYDMVGNVWQWVDATAVKDPYRYGLHVCCGGSFRNTNVLLQTAFCVSNLGPRGDTGFRVARALK